jgi:hypothetical protein
MFDERLQHANLDGTEATAASKDERCFNHSRLLFRAHRELNYSRDGIVGSIMHA